MHKLILEKDIEAYFTRAVEKVGGMSIKFIPDNLRGWPDRIVILPGGRLVWVELKREIDGRIEPAQMVAHEELRRLGQRVEVVWSKKDADRLVKSFTDSPADSPADSHR